ncbi:MAG: transglycosylase SLT domain-containing protein [Dysgonamonadaceae bacterium]|jgi:membrane-bound lytic murein transglycosylase D|nr:transglycosylase SLT domain-containing protein [Dysgonamonadaceae bacterium]
MKWTKYLSFLIFFAAGINLAAQETESADNDTLFIPESWETDLGAFKQSQREQYIVRKKENPAYDEAATICDSLYAARLAALNNLIVVPYNDIIRRYIDLYVDRRRKTIEYILGLENAYFPMIEQKLDKHDLPLELKYLAVVESALNPMAVSHAGATGLWQFMLATGKRYDLEINSLVDERKDPDKSTETACVYLKDLYSIYGDWALAMSAYNCGPGNVNKAIRRAGGSRDYWKVYPFLPRETRAYVPMFLAINYVMEYYAHHQFRPAEVKQPPVTDTVVVNRPIHFDQIADVLKIDKELLRELNPQYKRDIVPGNSKSRAIRLPDLQAYAFIGQEDSIANYRKDELLAFRIGNMPDNNLEKITHRVRSGETLRSLERKYGVSATQIRKWNGLKSNRLKAGRRLIIYADTGGFSFKEPQK